jgi:uncharacterized protein
MNVLGQVPRAAYPFLMFPALLRANGFAIAPEQTTAFLEAIALLGPRSMADIRWAGRALFAPQPERIAAYNALFAVHFLDAAVLLAGPSDGETDAVRVQEDQRGFDQADLSGDVNQAGEVPTGSEVLTVRQFTSVDEGLWLRRFGKALPSNIPHRRGYRFRLARNGTRIDLRNGLKRAIRNDGEIMSLPHLKRRSRPRRVLCLIDVSGSMKQRTDAHLRFAHTLVQSLPMVEVFTFGTRLTRVTRALRLKRRDQALTTAASLVSDWDGGTRIGDALQAFLAVPRFAGYARGAIVLIISDGLERGDPAAMRDAVSRLSRRAWRLSWLSPLAVGADFRPETEALKVIRPFLDDLTDGSSIESITAHVMNLGRAKTA